MKSSEYSYIVSGLQGSGTSLMMRILGLGGLKLVRSKEEMNGREKFSLPPDIASREDVFSKYLGKVIKLPADRMLALPATGYHRVIFMLRTPEETRRKTGNAMSDYEQRIAIERCVLHLKKRKNVELVCIGFRDLVTHTESLLRYVALVGWPIDVDAALAGIIAMEEKK
jgi:hypothetical protein